MISLTTLIIAGAITLCLLLVSLALPNPITWLMTLAMGAVWLFILLPKYQGEQQAVQQGVVIQAAVQEVRQWSRKQSDTYIDFYEIIAVAPNPNSGEMYTFVSPPMRDNPQPYLGNTVAVTVVWSNPKAYVMDLSFLPFKVP